MIQCRWEFQNAWKCREGKCYRPTVPHVEFSAREIACKRVLQDGLHWWDFTVVNNSVHLLKVGNKCIWRMLLPFGCAYVSYMSDNIRGWVCTNIYSTHQFYVFVICVSHTRRCRIKYPNHARLRRIQTLRAKYVLLAQLKPKKYFESTRRWKMLEAFIAFWCFLLSKCGQVLSSPELSVEDPDILQFFVGRLGKELQNSSRLSRTPEQFRKLTLAKLGLRMV